MVELPSNESARGARLSLQVMRVVFPLFHVMFGASCGRLGFDALVAGDGTTPDAPVGDGRVGDGSLPPDVNLAFVTSTTHQLAGLGSPAGGDAVCAQRAVAAGLPGTYRAWLSSSAVSAAVRIGSARGWIRPDGQPVADSLTTLATGQIFYPIRVDEAGMDIVADLDTMALTATQFDGTWAGQDCANYTAFDTGSMFAGNATRTTGGWSALTTAGCSGSGRLYCFGIDFTTPVAPSPPTGRRAYLSNATFTPGAGGLVAADALCQSEADAAMLSGSFAAFLAPSGGTAASRFDSTGSSWTRLDGAMIAKTATELLAGRVDTSITLTSTGTYRADSVWTGALSPQAPGSDASTCVSWTSTAGTGGITFALETGARFFATSQTLPCSTPRHLYCLER